MKECVQSVKVGSSIKLVEYRAGDCAPSNHENNIAIGALIIIMIIATIISFKAMRSGKK